MTTARCVDDPAEGLRVAARAAPSRAAPLPARWQAAIWLTVIALHGLLVAVVDGWMRPEPRPPSRVLEVVWVGEPARPEHAIPPMPVPPARRARRTTAVMVPVAPLAAPESPATGAEASLDEPPEPPPASLFLPDGRIRMEQPDALSGIRWGDRERISLDRRVVLPGATDAAAAEAVAIRLREAMTPETVVLAVMQMLFGRPRPDDCQTVGQRLVMSDPGVSREIDMNKFRRICGGMGVREALRRK